MISRSSLRVRRRKGIARCLAIGMKDFDDRDIGRAGSTAKALPFPASPRKLAKGIFGLTMQERRAALQDYYAQELSPGQMMSIS